MEVWIAEVATGEAVSAHKYEAEKGKPRSATTVLRAVGVLAGILDTAVKQNRLTKNPARNTDNLPRKKSKKRHRYLSHMEVGRLADAAGARGPLVLTLAYLGLRWGEATELRVGDVNPLRRRVHVERSATAVKRVIQIGPVKSWEDRIVPLPSFLMEVIAEACVNKSADALLFPEPGATKHAGIPDLRDDRNGWWTLAVREAGLDRLTPHDLRHTCASLAVSAGANVKALQRMLGHKSAAMTLDIYADLFDDDLDQVAGVLDQARSDALVSKKCPPEESGKAVPA
ncbi:site-specific integrase [Microbacterium sp. BWT-B31]|uniref:tyrosine-type recombinase/integrase n=1 Tax=Microbacterium sp. BWT-B31 TaxID=3232072 RepID=UPI003529742A